MNISPEYLALNKKLHLKTTGWGTSARLRAADAKSTAQKIKAKSILDYGCGKGQMKQVSGLEMDEYDPAIEGKQVIAKDEYDMVICTDVMEHVEPEYVDNVLNEINGLFTKGAYLLIYLVPALHLLPDGSNCHRTVKPYDWWLEKVTGIFNCEISHTHTEKELVITATR